MLFLYNIMLFLWQGGSLLPGTEPTVTVHLDRSATAPKPVGVASAVLPAAGALTAAKPKVLSLDDLMARQKEVQT